MLRWDFGAAIGGMRVGDSFFIPCLECEKYRRQIYDTAKDYGVKVRCKKRTENYIKGLRTWRIR